MFRWLMTKGLEEWAQIFLGSTLAASRVHGLRFCRRIVRRLAKRTVWQARPKASRGSESLAGCSQPRTGTPSQARAKGRESDRLA
jgi:hypothetical protein